MHACVCNINTSLICPQCKYKRSVIFFKSPGIMLLVHHVFLLCISGSRTLHQCLYICHVTELYSEMSGKILDSFATIIYGDSTRVASIALERCQEGNYAHKWVPLWLVGERGKRIRERLWYGKTDSLLLLQLLSVSDVIDSR